MSTWIRTGRRAFTLIELLVAMSIIVVLSSLVLMVVVNMGERDGTTDAAGLTRQWLMIAKARAARDQGARGLRLVVGTDPNNIAKTSPFWVTECQYIEAPPILVTYPAQNGDFAPTGSPFDPRVEFTYTTSAGPAPPVGTITSKTCQIVNLRIGEAQQVQRNSILQLPVIGSWHRITNVVGPTQQGSTSYYTVTVGLDAFPDAQMGAAGAVSGPSYVTHLFGITSPPRALIGEPPLPLPKNICIDLTYTQDSSGNPIALPTPTNPATFPSPLPGPPYYEAPSVPQANTTGAVDYDILFAPDGTVLPVGAGGNADSQIFLWHRDYTKIRGLRSPLTINSIGGAPAFTKTYDMTPFRTGGEQQIVAIKCKSGGLGQFPVLWPNNGVYNPGEDPYFFARTGVTSP